MYSLSDEGRTLFDVFEAKVHQKMEDYNDMEVMALIKKTDPGSLSKTRAIRYANLIVSHPLIVCLEPDVVKAYVEGFSEEIREYITAMAEMEEELHRRKLLRTICSPKKKTGRRKAEPT